MSLLVARLAITHRRNGELNVFSVACCMYCVGLYCRITWLRISEHLQVAVVLGEGSCNEENILCRYVLISEQFAKTSWAWLALSV